MYIVLSNTNWTGHVNNWTSSNLSTAYNIRYGSTRHLHPNTTAGYSGTRYQIEVILPVKSGTTASRYGTSGSVKTMAQIANDIATSVSNALTNPDLSAAGGTVYAKNINSNRFALQNTAGVTYDITSSGTSPYTFETAVKTCLLYTSDAADE